MKFVSTLIALFITATIIHAQENTKEELKFTESTKRGAIVYEDFCVTCHLPNGKGEEKVVPPLAKSDYLMNNRFASIKGIKFGQKGEIMVNEVVYNNVMAPIGLTDEEIADVMNYITNSWGNTNKKMITVEEVSKIE